MYICYICDPITLQSKQVQYKENQEIRKQNENIKKNKKM